MKGEYLFADRHSCSHQLERLHVPTVLIRESQAYLEILLPTI